MLFLHLASGEMSRMLLTFTIDLEFEFEFGRKFCMRSEFELVWTLGRIEIENGGENIREKGRDLFGLFVVFMLRKL